MKQRVNFIKTRPEAVCPAYQSESAAGADLYAAISEEIKIAPGETFFVPTGISLEIPEGFVGLIYARSSLACKKGIAPANKVGVIDSDYRGEIMVALFNHSSEGVTVSAGDRIAQLVITPYLTAEFKEVQQLTETQRAAGGFGSTGK